MKVITSKDNAIYKRALHLIKKKYRDLEGLYLLEGVKPVLDALSVRIAIDKVFVRQGRDIPSGLKETDIVVLSNSLFDKLSSTENSQGVIAVAAKRIYDQRDFAAAAAGLDILVMDRVQDPGNIGTMIRTAEAAGYGGVVMTSGCGDAYGSKVVRAAAGSLFRMPVIRMQNAAETVSFLKASGRKLIVSCLDDEAVSCFNADMGGNEALVIGNEGSGVGEDFIKAADVKVMIPMKGSIESLNAAVAAGILMYRSQEMNF